MEVLNVESDSSNESSNVLISLLVTFILICRHFIYICNKFESARNLYRVLNNYICKHFTKS